MIRVTDVALEMIRDILKEEPESAVIRINVTPG
jgi:Fe-S cluster assembly iron-binding protein IscA